jgi:uncharacterized protein YecE (DUF72 family)
MPAHRGARTGCAGWSIASAHAARFGHGGSALERYATRLQATEINSSFYRSHRQATYARWAASVPARFRFSVKLPRQITHEARLQRCGPALDRFLDECGGLGDRLGGLLVQLPPSLAFDARVAAAFFAMLRRRSTVPIACEPRHRSWFEARAAALLTRHDVARVAADPAPHEGAADPLASSHWRYWRWHGSPRTYYSDYGDEALESLASRVAPSPAKGVVDWVIFDNTAHGHAVPNALRLQEMMLAKPRRGARNASDA